MGLAARWGIGPAVENVLRATAKEPPLAPIATSKHIGTTASLRLTSGATNMHLPVRIGLIGGAARLASQPTERTGVASKTDTLIAPKKAAQDDAASAMLTQADGAADTPWKLQRGKGVFSFNDIFQQYLAQRDAII